MTSVSVQIGSVVTVAGEHCVRSATQDLAAVSEHESFEPASADQSTVARHLRRS
jgi:hypothetical protein